ncbi:hypothetical protein [Ramlibacter sp.]|uniref:hypothetical protein n=1 Tax=Ramlibacter sp. TaxID=1917967 RepID=UPI002D7630E4|nr:hypothetical protein [Ramlibacter sp.]HYD76482.1 hypothetical protein [Ramlibacter sp.]
MIRVECLPSAAHAPAEPVAIWFGSRRVDVRSVLDRWYGADQRWWKGETGEGVYIVRLDEATGTWELAAVVGE